MSAIPSSLDEFLPVLSTTDTKIKLSVGSKLHSYLCDPSNSIECSDIGQFIDSLILWLQSSNYKVAQNSLDILTGLVVRMNGDFQTYLPSVLSYIVDKLGDSKETIREKAFGLLMKTISHDVASPQQLVDKIGSVAFLHKNSNVREQIMLFLTTVLDDYGSQSLHISKLVPHIVKLLSDPNASVRSTAFQTLVNIYKHVGERLRMDLQRKYSIPQNKLPLLMQAFDEIGASYSASSSSVYEQLASIKENKDQLDSAVISTTTKPAVVHIGNGVLPISSSMSSSSSSSYNNNNNAMITPKQMAKTPSSSSQKLTLTNNNNNYNNNNTNNNNQTGAVDEEYFVSAFEDVPDIRIYNGKEVEDGIKKACAIIENVNSDWSKRVEYLKMIRSLICADCLHYDEFYSNMNLLLPAFHMSIKDLRSQVVREVCVTIAYLSKNLGIKFEHFAESLLTILINLIQNSAKIMASSGLVCICFILKHTHSPRLIPILTANLKSKSKDIRRACCEFICIILQSWHASSMEKHLPLLQDAIKRGIADADQEARTHSRKAYWAFSKHFPDKADQLLLSLDISYRKLLTFNSNANSELSSSASKPCKVPINNHRNGANSNSSSSGKMIKTSPRSSSAVDLQAAKRAKVRAQYAALARNKVAAVTAAYLPKSKRCMTPLLKDQQTLERVGRTRNRTSISQPTSRSSSPSSKFSYNTNIGSPLMSISRPQRCLQTPKSRSTNTSREPSPSRFVTSCGKSSRIIPTQQPIYKPPVIAQKILQQSQEAESALADALGNNWGGTYVPADTKLGLRRVFRSLEDHSDESETSSICSDYSFDCYNKKSFDLHSWNNDSSSSPHWLLQQQQYTNSPTDWKPTNKSINDIISLCKSTFWNERKEGLICIQYYIDSGNTIPAKELKQLMDIFVKIFNDPHTKVFGLFLDSLNKIIISHHNNLHFCLRLLLTRLLNKLGTDLLTSVQTKIMKTLHKVLVSFPADLQIHSVFQFLVDPTQTPNAQVKIASLNYITKLTYMTDPSLVFNSNNNSNNGDKKDYSDLAFFKIVDWTVAEDNVKSRSDVRKAAEDCLIALFNLNTPEVTLRFSSLSYEKQQKITDLIRTKQQSSGSSNNGGGSEYENGLCSSNSFSFKSSPSSLKFRSALDNDKVPIFVDDSSSIIDPSDSIDASFKRLSLAIHDTLSNDSPEHPLSSDVTSNISTTGGGLDDNDYEDDDDDDDTLKKLVDSLSNNTDNTESVKKDLLLQIEKTLQETTSEIIIRNFKILLRLILSLISNGEKPIIKEISLRVLQTIAMRKTITFCFKHYSELVLLKVMTAGRDKDKNVVRAVENCAIILSMHLPGEYIIRVVVPLVASDDYPVNLLAIKMLTHLVEHSKDSVAENVNHVMQSLLTAYDNSNSSVRKSAVFCMVAIHTELGEDTIAPYIVTLSGAKLKLLQLYIKKNSEKYDQYNTDQK